MKIKVETTVGTFNYPVESYRDILWAMNQIFKVHIYQDNEFTFKDSVTDSKEDLEGYTYIGRGRKWNQNPIT
jgi:hypothetical protein